MTNKVISIENISKQYHLGTIGTGTFYNDLKVWWAKQHGKPNPLAKVDDTDFGNRDGEAIWALRNVSIDVNQGEALGIIGRNGAGKSTLLKILSRVTAPTTGIIKVKGRIASLLEVGTGFHPELTGRENTYLNGAILGMSREEVNRKFDEIVDFSGVEKFIDTPVKRYSSGMYVRLAFAVAAHLEPEILVVDEVLAVGDAEFQKKCLGKMSDVTGEGRTVLFVSHNMASVLNLCKTGIILDNGSINYWGNTEEAIDKYINKYSQHDDLLHLNQSLIDLPSNDVFRFISINVVQNGKPTNHVQNNDDFSIVFEYEVISPHKGLRVYFDIVDTYGNIIIRNFHDENEPAMSFLQNGFYKSTATFPKNILAPKTYTILFRATIYNSRTLVKEDLKLSLIVHSMNGINNNYPNEPIRSLIQPLVTWDTTKV